MLLVEAAAAETAYRTAFAALCRMGGGGSNLYAEDDGDLLRGV